MPEKLPVPTEESIKLLTQDVGSVFQGKMNSVVVALRNAMIAFNAQIDAAETASQQVEPAPEEVALEGTNNTYKMTPLRSAQLILKLLTVATADEEGALDEVAGKLITAEHSAKLIRKLLTDATADEEEALAGTSDKLINALLLDLVLEWRLGTTGNLGTAAQRNVMTSLTDTTTPDALMPRGAFGAGSLGNAPSIANFNTYQPAGFYSAQPTTVGKPDPEGWGSYVASLGSSAADRAAYLIIRSGSAAMRAWLAKREGGTLSSVELFHSGNLIGTVAAGNVIEEGSNPNGWYTKLLNGTMFGYKRVQFSGVTINPANGSNVSTAQPIDVSAPATFVGQVVITVGRYGLNSSSGSPIYTSLVSDSTGFSLVNTGRTPVDSWPSWTTAGLNIATQGFYEVFFIGRWK